MKSLWVIMLLLFMFYPPPTYADECIEGNCKSGYGTMLYSTGHKYIGEFKEAQRDGKGILFLPGGRKLEGVWENGQIIEGTYTLPDGTKYVGHWKFFERNGQGELTFSDGRKYIGEFKDGERSGHGTLIYPDGKKLVGEFRDGEFLGN